MITERIDIEKADDITKQLWKEAHDITERLKETLTDFSNRQVVVHNKEMPADYFTSISYCF